MVYLALYVHSNFHQNRALRVSLVNTLPLTSHVKNRKWHIFALGVHHQPKYCRSVTNSDIRLHVCQVWSKSQSERSGQQFLVRPNDNDDGRIGGMRKVGGDGRTPRKPVRTVFVDHKAHMAQAGIEPRTPTCQR